MRELGWRSCFLLMAVIFLLSGCGGDPPVSPESSASTETYPSLGADAGPDQTVEVGSRVFLSGSGSSAFNRYQVTYAWSFVYLPAGSSATLSNGHSSSPFFLADVEGLYMLKLVVSDGRSDSSADIVAIHAER